MKKDNVELKKDLRPIDVWGLALGAIIGWGCFVLPGDVFLPKAGPLGTTIGLGIGAIMMIIISLSYGYLIVKHPTSGGEYVYASSTFGKTNGFICGWFLLLAYWSLIPLNGTAVALIFRYLFPGFIQQGLMYEIAGWEVYAGEIIVASLFIIIMGIVNICGIKKAAWIQTAISLTLVGGILIITSMVLLDKPLFTNLGPGFPIGTNWFDAIFAIVAMSPWAFIGFDCIPQAAEEYKFSHKYSIWLMICAIIIAAILYISINFVTSVIMPWQELIESKQFWATGYVVELSIGKIGLILLGIAMLCAVISGMNAFYISTSRLMYAMSNSYALPRAFGKLHPKYGTPHKAIIFILILSLIAPWFGRQVLTWIVDMTSVGAVVVFGYTTTAAMIASYKDKNYFQTIFSFIGILLSIFFLSLLVVPGMPGFLSIQSIISLGGWVILGFIFYISRYPVFAITKKKKFPKVSTENNAVIITMAYPQEIVRTTPASYSKILPYIGIGIKGFIRAGHACYIIIKKNDENLEFFDCGRYIAPVGWARIRSYATDPKTIMEVKAKWVDGELTNLEEILKWVYAHPDNSGGYGDLYASLCLNANYETNIAYVKKMQSTGIVKYGPFVSYGSNCSRFVTDALLNSVLDENIVNRIAKLYMITPSVLGNVAAANSFEEYYVVSEDGIRKSKENILLVQRRLLQDFGKGYEHLVDTQIGKLEEPKENKGNPAWKWLGGIGYGAWYHIEECNDSPLSYKVAQYNADGSLAYSTILKSEKKLDLSQDYSFDYPSQHNWVRLNFSGKIVDLYASSL